MARDSRYLTSVCHDLAHGLAQLEYQESKSDPHSGLEKERNRGHDRENGSQRFRARSPAAPT
jgi:hypothetical protein